MNKNKINVMFFVCGLKSGGVEQMLINYSSHMNYNKYSFIIVYQHEAVKECLRKFEELNFKVERITARSENFLKSIADTFKIISKYRPDVIHSNMNLMNFIPNMVGKIYGIPVRISHSHIAERDLSFAYRFFLNICQQLILSSSNIFLSCGEDASLYLHGNKVSSKIIKNAIDIERFNNCSSKLLNRGYEGKYVIGHVGRFSTQKNHKRLIEIFKVYTEINPNSVLVLAGTGELKKDIEALTRKMSLDDKVVFLGAIDNMPAFYASLDLFILPSLWEGFPVVSLEVQAAEVRAIFSDKIDASVKLTDYISFMSLDRSDVEWAKAVENIRLEHAVKSDNALEKLKNAGFDINQEAQILDKVYSEALEKFSR